MDNDDQNQAMPHEDGEQDENAPLELSDEWFENEVVAVLDSLPAEFADNISNLEIVVEPRARGVHRRAVGLKPWQSLYGLYQGVPLTSRTHNYGLVPPDIITIFSGTLLRDFPTEEALRRQIRRTVLHELAHHFGIDDARLHELGAY